MLTIMLTYTHMHACMCSPTCTCAFLRYQMRPNTKVLQGISLKIPAGKTCALVGKSGGGKSTLVHLMMRFYDPCSGDILLDGTNLRQLSLQHVHDECGLVAQDTQLFGSTVRQNIMYGVEDSIALAGEDVVQVYSAAGTYRGMCPRRIVEAAKEANCHDFIREFEDGYEHTDTYTHTTHTHTTHTYTHTTHTHTCTCNTHTYACACGPARTPGCPSGPAIAHRTHVRHRH